MNKKEIFEKLKEGKTSEDFTQDSEIYYAILAYEYYGNATRDNTFLELVSLGKEIENGSLDE